MGCLIFLAPIAGALDFVCSPTGSELHVHLKRIPIEEIPMGEAELERWLHERFGEKDKYLEEFYAPHAEPHPVFPDRRDPDAVLPLRSTLPTAALFASLLVPILVSRAGRRAYISIWVLGTIGSIMWLKYKKAA